MGELKLDFFPESKISNSDLGFPEGARAGKIIMSVVHCDACDVILDVCWNLDDLLNWLEENSKFLMEESLPNFVRWDESIRKSIDNIYDNFDSYTDDQLDELFEYRRRHEVCFGMRGVAVPTIYIGMGNFGAEVSGEYEGKEYRHSVELGSFFANIGKF